MEKVYTVGEIIQDLISESSNEFKPVLGPNVEKDNKEINGKAYKDAQEVADAQIGKMKKTVGEDKPKYVKGDYNRTTLDYTMTNVPQEYKDRVKAQVLGYNSELEMNNGIEKSGDFSGNKDIYDGIKKSGEEIHKKIVGAKQSGLVGRTMPKSDFEKEEMYEGANSKEGMEMLSSLKNFRAKLKEAEDKRKEENINKPVKVVYFKKTSFLNEGYMKERIPDEFKCEGLKFKMKDKDGVEYLVEWANGEANILSRHNKKLIDEAKERYNRLSNYSSVYSEKQSNQERINESTDEISRMLKIMRGLKEQNNTDLNG